MSIKSLGGFTNAFHVKIGRGTKPVERGIWEAGGGGGASQRNPLLVGQLEFSSREMSS